MSDALILYIGEKNISSWSMRGYLALEIKGVPYQERTISLAGDTNRAQRRAVSPTGKVPVLHAGSLVIPDSLAIIEYLEEAYPAPAHPALWPGDPSERAHARWLAAAMHAGFAKIREEMSFNRCFLPERTPVSAEALAEAGEMLSYWETALARGNRMGPFLFGPFCAADAMYAPAVVRLTSFEVGMARTPRAAAYAQAVLAHPPVRKWMDAARALPPRESY